MTNKELLNMSIDTFNKMSKKELSKAVVSLGKSANPRLARAEKSGFTSPAVRYMKMSGGKVSAKGKNLNELRGEFMRAKGFLESKTGTQQGWRETKRQTINTLKGKGINVSQKNFDTMWETYEKLKEISPDVANKRLKYSALSDISNKLKAGQTEDDIIDDIIQKMTQEYEAQEELENESEMSDFFEI